jgi:hypothetical protein
VLTGLVLAAALAAGAVAFRPRPDRITEEILNRIEEGMSPAETEAVLGGPPGDYRTVSTMMDTDGIPCVIVDIDRSAAAADRYFALDPEGCRVQAAWFGNEGYVQIGFESGTVKDKEFYRTVNRKQSPLDTAVWRARRLWRRWFP